jgi:hypothetical protein
LTAGAPPWLKVSSRRILRLPLRSRSPTRLLKHLRPILITEPLQALAWIICEELYCYVCLWPVGEYKVSFRKAKAFDRLSGLTHEVVVEANGHVGDELVWTARWDGSFLVLSKFRCKARVLPDGRVLCLHQEGCRGPQCLARCLGLTGRS